MNENNPLRAELIEEQTRSAISLLKDMCSGLLPAPLTAGLYPPGYIEGWNDCLSLIEEKLGWADEPRYTITDLGRELLEKSTK